MRNPLLEYTSPGILPRGTWWVEVDALLTFLDIHKCLFNTRTRIYSSGYSFLGNGNGWRESTSHIYEIVADASSISVTTGSQRRSTNLYRLEWTVVGSGKLTECTSDGSTNRFISCKWEWFILRCLIYCLLDPDIIGMHINSWYPHLHAFTAFTSGNRHFYTYRHLKSFKIAQQRRLIQGMCFRQRSNLNEHLSPAICTGRSFAPSDICLKRLQWWQTEYFLSRLSKNW